MTLYYGANIVTSGLVMLLDAANPKSYPGSGTTWSDISRNGNNGTLVGSPTYSANNNGYFTFNGSTQYANTATSVNLGSVFTISAWIYPTTAGSCSTILSNIYNGATSNGFKFFINTFQTSDRTIQIETGNGSLGQSTISASGSITYSTWNHVVAVLNKTAGTGTIYLNGSLLTSGSIRTDLSSNNILYVGTAISNPNFAATGTVSSVKRGIIPGFVNETRTSLQRIIRSNFINEAATDLTLKYFGRLSVIGVYTVEFTADQVTQNFNAYRGRYGL
ncbi:Concanavalin A-like lectin/glucanases superfamily [uncultured Caudovirales phage]|uniref:Concanavalin A-like lectin/glucanases superfamily n=1 Tax=uncultured Caudovirales phage TaxID=2100421 RepID=A0A6J5KPP0_9CAUD|nr:Concanavalin A-like lectin/glucanases superfamily [uncultured Caudovirales phage]